MKSMRPLGSGGKCISGRGCISREGWSQFKKQSVDEGPGVQEGLTEV